MKDAQQPTPDTNPSRKVYKPGVIAAIGIGLLALSAIAIESGPYIARNLGEGIGNAKCVIPYYEAAIKRLEGRNLYNENLPPQANIQNILNQASASSAVVSLGVLTCNIPSSIK